MEAKVKRLPDGRAEVEFVNGDRYVGELKDNRLTGKGTMWYADGRVYEGAFLNGEWHGKGKATWKGGGSFGGYWFHNKRQGFGREIVVNERGEEISEYGGVFKNDILDGEGWMNWPDGSRLTGIFSGRIPGLHAGGAGADLPVRPERPGLPGSGVGGTVDGVHEKSVGREGLRQCPGREESVRPDHHSPQRTIEPDGPVCPQQ